MSNFYLAVLSTFLCLTLGITASGLTVFSELDGAGIILSSIIGIVCLPLGIFMGYLAFKERPLDA